MGFWIELWWTGRFGHLVQRGFTLEPTLQSPGYRIQGGGDLLSRLFFGVNLPHILNLLAAQQWYSPYSTMCRQLTHMFNHLTPLEVYHNVKCCRCVLVRIPPSRSSAATPGCLIWAPNFNRKTAVPLLPLVSLAMGFSFQRSWASHASPCSSFSYDFLAEFKPPLPPSGNHGERENCHHVPPKQRTPFVGSSNLRPHPPPNKDLLLKATTYNLKTTN